MTNAEIVEKYTNNGLIDECIMFQFKKMDQPWKNQYKQDLRQDIVVYMMNYPNLQNVEKNNHMNAWLTRVIINQIYSNSSAFYLRYIRHNQYWNGKQVDIDEIIERETLDDGEEED